MYVARKKKKFDFKKIALTFAVVIGIAGTGLIGVQWLTNAKGQERAGNTLIEEVVSEKVKKPVAQTYYYPKYEDEGLNQLVFEVVEEVKTTYEGQEVQLDYSSHIAYDQYVVIAFEAKNEKEKDEYYINYDLKTKQKMDLDDVFRFGYRDYFTDLGIIFGEQPRFAIMEDSIQVEQYKITMNDHGDLLKLKHEKIPSLYQGAPLSKVTREIDPNKPMIAFSFDDGPRNLSALQRISETLATYQSSATFFIIGDLLEMYPERVVELYEKGFEIANHTYEHTMYTKDNLEEIVAQVKKTQDLIYATIGEDSTLYRPVAGAFDLDLMNALPVDIAYWSVDTEDWLNRNAQLTYENTLRDVKDGAVVLFHDIYDSTAEAIERLVPELIAQGYQIVSISELLEAKGSSNYIYRK